MKILGYRIIAQRENLRTLDDPVKVPGAIPQWIGFWVGLIGFVFGLSSAFVPYYFKEGEGRTIPYESLSVLFWISVFCIIIFSTFLLICIRYIVQQDKYVKKHAVRDAKRKETISNLNERLRGLQDDLRVLEKNSIEEKYRQINDKNEVSKFVAVHFLEITKRARDVSAEFIKLVGDGHNFDRLREIILRDIQYIGRVSAETFTKTTGFQCSTSIKTISIAEPEKGTNFVTIDRHAPDHQRRMERDKSSDGTLKSHELTSNTAFLNIVKSKEDYFIFNKEDTGSLKFITFHNNDWNQFYDACLIVPICGPSRLLRTTNTRRNGDAIIGFFCVDNFGGDFRIEYELKIAWQISYYLFMLLEILAYTDRFVDKIEEKQL